MTIVSTVIIQASRFRLNVIRIPFAKRLLIPCRKCANTLPAPRKGAVKSIVFSLSRAAFAAFAWLSPRYIQIMSYVLHYAPDNASLVVRLVLEELRLPYRTELVDRSIGAQHSKAYKNVNPVGRIPALETPDGPIFETAAICLWLADRHRDAAQLSPGATDPKRGPFLSWLFFLSNTVHAEMRSLFYPSLLVGPDPTTQFAVSSRIQNSLSVHLDLLDARDGNTLGNFSICDLYLAVLLRWPALYPALADRQWFDLSRWPNLQALAQKVEARDSARAAANAEGLGPTPFSNPQPATPPEGSAL